MATVSFRYRSTKDFAPLTLRFEHNKKQYHTITRILVENDFKNYYKKTVRSKKLLAKQDSLDERTKPLTKFVLEEFYKLEDLDLLSNDWLKTVYKTYRNPENNNPEQQYITYWIDYKIKNSKTFKNSKNSFGLSKSSISGLKSLKKLVILYEDEILDRKLKLSDLTEQGFEAIKYFLFDLEYKPTSIHTLLTQIKAIGNLARKKKMKLPDGFNYKEIPKSNTHEEDEDIIYLTKDELKRIELLDIKQDYLDNARKWLLLGCYTGQRIGDQLNKINSNNIILKSEGLAIELKQGKTNKKVIIPIHPVIEKMYNNNEMPRPISRKNLNIYIKEVCELAEINEIINDQKKEFVKEKKLNSGKVIRIHRKTKRERPKHEYIATHTGRRTFCMLYYGKIPMTDIMSVTGHTTDKVFLSYINKTNEGHIESFKKEFDKH